MKRIAIIGGGISGLAVLHYLKQRLGILLRLLFMSVKRRRRNHSQF